MDIFYLSFKNKNTLKVTETVLQEMLYIVFKQDFAVYHLSKFFFIPDNIWCIFHLGFRNSNTINDPYRNHVTRDIYIVFKLNLLVTLLDYYMTNQNIIDISLRDLH